MQAVDIPANGSSQLHTDPGCHSGGWSPRRVLLPGTVGGAPIGHSPRGFRKLWKPRQYSKWESPVLMGLFFVLGLGISMAHCGFYASLEGTIVGSPAQQENNLR